MPPNSSGNMQKHGYTLCNVVRTVAYRTVVKRTRVPAGSLIKMAKDAETLQPGLCEL